MNCGFLILAVSAAGANSGIAIYGYAIAAHWLLLGPLVPMTAGLAAAPGRQHGGDGGLHTATGRKTAEHEKAHSVSTVGF